MKTAMIWGGSGGIGKALTAQLVSDDWDVIAIGRDENEIDDKATLALQSDVTNAFSVQDAVLSAGYEFDEIALWIYLEAFVEALRKEERKRQVILVRPGAVATSFWDKVPMRLPKDAATPEKVAERIVTAHAEGYEGVLDLV